MWMAALTVSTSANTLPVTRQLLLPLSSQRALAWRMCRTTFATLVRSDPADVQGILGHSTVDMTMGFYRKPITERRMAAAEELEARLRGKVVTMKPAEKAG